MSVGDTISWDDLRLFLDVARLGGLSAATSTTGLSAATLGRRVTALEQQIGEPLFIRRQTGYQLTPAGEELLARAEDVEAAMRALTRWRDGSVGEQIVRISAGTWTSAFLARHIGELWHVDDVSWTGVRTFYTRFGDVFVYVCAAVTVVAIVAGLVRRPRG